MVISLENVVDGHLEVFRQLNVLIAVVKLQGEDTFKIVSTESSVIVSIIVVDEIVDVSFTDLVLDSEFSVNILQSLFDFLSLEFSVVVDVVLVKEIIDSDLKVFDSSGGLHWFMFL